MEIDHERANLPIGPILYGCVIAVLAILVFALLFSLMTQFGWTGTVRPYSNNIFLIADYLAIILGSIMAGRKSAATGWMVGIGVGFLCSLALLLLTALMRQPVLWGVFTVKTLISCFIGTFGGIIGVNLAGSRG
ncbi:MAG TPA: TIGR04086 family membrane protein [Bacillota bacterium]